MLATIFIPLLMISPETVQGRHDHILRQFAASVDAYVRLHRDASEFTPRALCGGPEELETFRTLLADEIRRLRTHAPEGAIFGHQVSALIRKRLQGVSAAEVLDDEGADIGSDGRPFRWTAEVNFGYPPYYSARDPAVFRDLPPLPGELEYRVVGRDLVLLDVIANLVVDVLRDAIR